MKLLILSDSHGYRKTLYNIIRDHPDADAIIFLGDGELDFKDAVIGCHLIPDKMILQVRGNCDRTSHEPETIIREFDGVRFLITHGHALNVKCGLQWIAAEARKLGCKVALFGHTHRKHYEERDGVILINPGSAGQGSYCYLKIENGELEILSVCL